VSERGHGDQDEALLRRLRRRDEAAFRELVERHQAVVRAYAAGILRDPTEAEDAAQETFLRAFRRLPAYRGDAPVLAWLLRICRNHCVDRLRARPPEAVELREELLPAAAGSDPASEASVTIDRERLVSAIGRLSDPLQQVVVLRELRGLSYEEVATALDIPIGTVRSRLHAANAQLRRALRP
jgi:RNA polymerase sigma-70 factor, ECF subfamily